MNLRRHWLLLVPAAFAVSIFHAWLGSGLIIGDDQFRFSNSVVTSYFPWRSAWDGSVLFGSATADASPAYPLWSIAGALVRAGADFAVVERVLWLWPLLACLVIAPYVLAYRLTRSTWAAAIGAAVFAVNTWTVALVQRGHIPSLVAYALMPFAVLAWRTLLVRRMPWPALRFAAIVTLQVMYDLRYAYITAIACVVVAAIFAVVARSRGVRLEWTSATRAGVWTALALLAFNAYWLVPQIVAPARLPAGYDTLPFYLSASSSESLQHALALYFPFYMYVQGTDPFGREAVQWAFYSLPLIVALAAIAARRAAWTLPLTVCALIGIIVVSGPDSPFGHFNEYAFLHLPGMKLFRDSSKFTALVAFSYALIVSLGAARVLAFARLKLRPHGRVFAAASACIALAAYAGLMHGAYDPARHSNFTSTMLSASDAATQRFLDSQPGFFRTALFPTWRPRIVGTELHPVVATDYLLDSASQDGGLDNLFSSSASLLERLDSPLMPALLAEGGVRYVIVDDDPGGELYEPFAYDVQYAQSLQFFRRQPWLKEATHFGRYVVFKLVPPAAPRAFFAPAPVAVAGTPQSLVAVIGTPAWQKLPAVVMADAARHSPQSAWIFSEDPALAADGIVSSFTAGAEMRVRAYVGAEPATLGAPEIRSRMIDARELKASPLPTEPLLPSTPVAAEIADPRMLSAPYPDPAAGTHWLGLVGPRADISIVNWSYRALTCDVFISRAFVPDARARELRTTVGGVSQTFALKAGGADGARAIDIRDVHLVPGLNVLHLVVTDSSALNSFSLIFADDVRVTATAAGAPVVGPEIAKSSVRATADGLKISVAAGRNGRTSVAAFAIFHDLAMPLARRPTITLNYQAPADPARLALFLELRDKNYGRREQFFYPLSSASDVGQIDIFSGVQAALDAESRTGSVRPEASQFDLEAVRLAILAPPRASDGDIVTQIASAVIDENAPVDTPPLMVRYADLRRTNVGTAYRATRSEHELTVTARAASDPHAYDIGVPIDTAAIPSRIVFWLHYGRSASPAIDLIFTRAGGSTTIVSAARRPADTDPDSPLPVDWQARVIHVADGSTGAWQRFVIDVDDVKAYRLPNDGAGYTLTALRLHGLTRFPGDRATLSDVAAIAAGAVTSGSMTQSQQALMANGNPVPIRSWRVDGMTNRIVGESDPFTIGGRTGISVEPTLPLRGSSIYLSRATTSDAATGIVDRFTELSPAEFEVRVRGDGGLFVWPSSFAPGWRAYVIGARATPPSGNPMFDALRLRNSALPIERHIAVNSIFNGWRLPAGNALLLLLYEPEAASEFGALLWISLSLVIVVAAAVATRERP